MKKEFLNSLINEALTERLKGVASFKVDEESFSGFQPLEKIRGQLFQWVAVPFNRVQVFCQLRCPNGTQIEQCGDISSIVIGADKGKKLSREDMITIHNYQEELCKITFNIPTYDQLAELTGSCDFVLSDKNKELASIRKRYEDAQEALSEVEKETIISRIRTLELQTGYILPDDTMAFITHWAMGHDVSDIKKLTKENFLRAASLAKAHHKAPSDYISGRFTDHNKPDIDAYAETVLREHLKEHEAVAGSKFQWFLGGRKRTSDMALLPKKPGVK